VYLIQPIIRINRSYKKNIEYRLTNVKCLSRTRRTQLHHSTFVNQYSIFILSPNRLRCFHQAVKFFPLLQMRQGIAMVRA
jgi:hypothetical protein